MGFEKQPTTNNFRPFQLRLNNKTRAMERSMSKDHCFEPHLFLNEYLEQFIRAYPDSPKASLIWPSYFAHDYPDDPFHADKQYLRLFERNREEFDNSFVFFMADHGLRVGWLSRHPDGKRDVNNPMLMISVPRRMRENKYLIANLKKNSGELLTMFDTHATLVDIVETLSGRVQADFSKTAMKPELKGTSLLRPLPQITRNCKTLPIPPQYCLCEIAKEPVKFVV
ncbi:hypothetical protein PMAYCL1PPCAC_13490 [Pristionchus mayeri]|uniref:Uncharacterized protein n=1 Tax=Pristionchus mayeri TaxID=1317129 RepID=A0AAN5CEW3_9BILA|nr:hypothetical protein PMAYCL1PPCAC_13490 [Pristionchus mayeri]